MQRGLRGRDTFRMRLSFRESGAKRGKMRASRAGTSKTYVPTNITQIFGSLAIARLIHQGTRSLGLGGKELCRRGTARVQAADMTLLVANTNAHVFTGHNVGAAVPCAILALSRLTQIR